jgi:hypothetical protein
MTHQPKWGVAVTPEAKLNQRMKVPKMGSITKVKTSRVGRWIKRSSLPDGQQIHERRFFLTMLGAAGATLAFQRPLFGVNGAVDAQSTPPQLHIPVFRSRDPRMVTFADHVFHDCIQGRIRSPEPPLRHAWLIPGGVYVGQWVWDTTFLTDLIAIAPENAELIRGVYDNFWDFQKRWNAAKPEYAHGMIANFIAPNSGPPGFSGKDWLHFPAYSQAPLLAWGVERVYRRNGDLSLVRCALAPLEAFHDWYWRERDLDDIGLVTVGSYDGKIQDARYETYDNEVDLDSLQLTTNPKRPQGPDNGPWYGDIYIPANTAYLLLSEMSLIRLAQAAGDSETAMRRRPFVRRGIEAMRRYMWDHEQGCFLAVRRQNLQKVATATVGGMVPLCAQIPTRQQAARMAQTLAGHNWNTPIPVPTVDALSSQYRSNSFWRGDMWPAPAYQVVSGLASYGHRKLAGEFSGRILENALKVGISEHYDSQTGEPLGVRNLGMSGVLLTMALGGFNPQFAIHVGSQKM